MEIFFLTVLFFLGISVGSFLGVIVDRVTLGKSILGRSQCDYCKKTLDPFALVPLLSYVFSGGKSLCCSKKLTWWYPLIELITGIMFVLTWSFLGTTIISKIILLGIVSCLIVVVCSDIKYQLIADEVQLTFAILAFLYVVLLNPSFPNVLQHILAGVYTSLPLFLIHTLTKGKGMGFADVKLAFTFGFLLGMPLSFVALYIGFISGALYGAILLILRKAKAKSEIPFGPFLVLGIISTLFYKQHLLELTRLIFPF